MNLTVSVKVLQRILKNSPRSFKKTSRNIFTSRSIYVYRELIYICALSNKERENITKLKVKKDTQKYSRNSHDLVRCYVCSRAAHDPEMRPRVAVQRIPRVSEPRPSVELCMRWIQCIHRDRRNRYRTDHGRRCNR